MPNPAAFRVLARAFLGGEQSPEGIAARGAVVLGREWQWLQALAKRYLRFAEGKTRPRHRDVVEFLRRDAGLRRTKYFHSLAVSVWQTQPEEMRPAAAAADWPLPRIESCGDLADWLHIAPAELDWYADLKDLNTRAGASGLQHYHWRLLPKKSGGVRVIEAPKRNLKEIQRRILAEILELVPAHPAVHGFVKGRSIRTFAAPHAGRSVVLRMDLQDFFPGFRAARIQALFRTFGYPEAVADRLGGLCTNALRGREAPEIYRRPHLPQGAPTSPALANICSYRLDCRLAGLAEAAAVDYTRYADDLAFSGGPDFVRGAKRFSAHVAAILLDEGFAVNFRKTRIMRQGVRQHLAGLVVNSHVNVDRGDYDELKAILTNCVRHGLESQNRKAHPAFREHLAGRVGFVESVNLARGKKLRAILDGIAMDSA